MAPRKKVADAEVIKQEKIENVSAEQELSLEEAFEQLDSIMGQLEQGETKLEDSFLLYQKGMQLLKQCNESIDRVEKKLIVLEEEGI